MPSAGSEEAKNFRLLGHDPSAALGRRQPCRGEHRPRLCRRRRHARPTTAPEGFTVARRDATRASRARSGSSRRRPASTCTSCASSTTTSSTSTPSGSPATRARAPPHRALHLRHQPARRAAPGRLLRHAGQRPAPLRRRQRAQARALALRRRGLDRRVIWTLDIRDPLKPEIVSIWGLPWQKDGGSGAAERPAGRARACLHAARAAGDPRQPHVRRLLGRRRRHHRLHRPCRHEAARPRQLDAALRRLRRTPPGRSATGPI